MEGGRPDSRKVLPPELRDWQLVSKFGWTFEEIQEQPAVWLDWILRIDNVHVEAQNKAQKG
jgi:hypothetical protein